MSVLGVDLRGATIQVAEVNGASGLTLSIETPSNSSQGFLASLSQLYRAIEESLHPRVEAVGVCVPGPLNAAQGVVVESADMPGWRNIPLTQLLQARFHLPCRLETSARAEGLGETLYGAGRGHRVVFYAAAQPALATALIVEGEILGEAGDGAHMTVDYRSSALCSCGLRGCVSVLAKEDREDSADLLAAWLLSGINLVGPDLVVLSEVVLSEGSATLLPKLESMSRRRVVAASLGFDARLLGAAAAAQRSMGTAAAAER